MPLQIIRQDITKMECDAVVNATNSALTCKYVIHTVGLI